MTRQEWIDLLERDERAQKMLKYATGAEREVLLRERRENVRLINHYGHRQPTTGRTTVVQGNIGR